MIDAFLLICSFCVNNKKLKKKLISLVIFFKSIIFAHVVIWCFLWRHVIYNQLLMSYSCKKNTHKLAFLLDIFL